jgi:hypothetical protein
MKKQFVDWYIYTSCVVATLYFLDDIAGVLAVSGVIETYLLYGSFFLVPTGFVACLYGGRKWGGAKYLFLGFLLGAVLLIVMTLIGLIAF